MKLEDAVLMLLNIKANEYHKYLRGAYSICLFDPGMFFTEQVKGWKHLLPNMRIHFTIISYKS